MVYGSLEQPTGGYVYDRIVVAGLRAAGDDVDVVSIEPGSNPLDLVDRVSQREPDVIVGDALAVTELGPAFERLSCPRVLLVHHLASWEEEVVVDPAEESRAISASSALFATSETSARRLAREYPGRRATVVFPGADRLERMPRGSTPSVTLLAVGTLTPRKRLGLILDAFQRIESPHVRLRVIGDPNRDPTCAERLLSRMALDARVEFLGVVSDEALALELAQADALVLASSLEGYGMVLTEACHAGLPAFVARSAALSEVTDGAPDVMLFDDLDNLEAQLRSFVADPALRLERRQSARDRGDRLPRWSDTVARFREELIVSIR